MNSLRRVSEYASALIFFVMFLCFIIQVVGRYVFNIPAPWAGELALLSFIWFVFVGCAFVLTKEENIRIDIVYRMLPEGGRRVASMIVLVVTAGLFAAALPATFDYTSFMNWQTTPVLMIGFGYAFSIMVIFMAAYVIRALVHLWRLLRADWRREI
ncbi:MAG: TRAP transporter small permease [Pseudomonadota bacterium]|nr:TRAP transporter small permease [Pseudomonadota bacterium]